MVIESTVNPMAKINVLLGDPSVINTRGLYQPLLVNKDRLNQIGYIVEFYTKLAEEIIECDILVLDSKYFKPYWVNQSEKVLSKIEELGEKVNKLIWFNTADSTGSIQTQVLPFVDRYFKSQVLKNRETYSKLIYGDRFYCDYYHRVQGIADENEIFNTPIDPQVINQKLRLSWNYGLAGGYCHTSMLDRVWRYSNVNSRRGFRNNEYRSPELSRPQSIFLRMNTNYARETIAYQRKKTISLLRSHNPPGAKVSKRRYFRELAQSQAAISPFGWGEINIRDFECFCAGSVLIKPDMDHLLTYPDFYGRHQSYVPYRWDFSDLEDVVEDVISNYHRYADIARHGQELFRRYADSDSGKDEFVQRVRELVEEAQRATSK